jgi:hypothetical protein
VARCCKSRGHEAQGVIQPGVRRRHFGCLCSRAVFCLRLMVLVGLNASFTTIVSPLASPPWMPPDLQSVPITQGL